MKLTDAEDLARQLMAEHGLIDQGWVFRFDRSTIRFGNCQWKITAAGTKKTLSLSRHLTSLNDRADVEDTIRHEIAHALAGLKAAHGAEWVKACGQTGANPARCYDSAVIVRPEAPYNLLCESCDARWPRWRRSRHTYLCGRCRSPLIWTKVNR